MSNVVYIATSIDGFIAKIDGNIDWLMQLPNPDKSDYGFSDFLKRMDGIIMGRRTFETVLGFKEWPYPKSLPLFILSNKLKHLPTELPAKAEIVNGGIKSIIAALNNRRINNLYIDGGLTIQSFLKEDLIDEMTITRVPILLGSGIPLFDLISSELMFEHIETEVLNNMLVRSKYNRVREL